MTWVEMEMAIADATRQVGMWRTLFVAVFVQLAGTWLALAWMERRVYRNEHGRAPWALHAWASVTLAVACLGLAGLLLGGR